ncbi:MAG TPA: mechanosensitive ion channel family protein [Burkholderiales bacterium]|nr:mechanosensitive ion channel family protein [Burkholderiales bacterium]
MHSLIIRLLRDLGISNPEEWANLLNAFLRIGIVLFLAWLVLLVAGRLIRLFTRYMARQENDPEQNKRVETLAQVFRYIASVVVFIVAGMLVLSELGISIAPVLATAGVAGVAIGFGAQSLVKDYFNGFCILVENQIRQGDVVQIAGLSGLVEEMTLRYVQLRDYEGNVHFVPNGAITTVTNMSRGFAFAVIDLGVGYKENIDEVMAAMREIAVDMRKDPQFASRILDELEMAGVEKLADSAVILRCRIRVLPLEQWNVKREYLRRIKTLFDERGIEMPFRQVTVNTTQPAAPAVIAAAAAAAASDAKGA